MPQSGLKVLKPGVLSLVQDEGRYGQASLGLSSGGAMDQLAYHWANRICGNPLNSVAIEVAIGGLEFQVLSPCVICVAGASVAISVNGQSKPQWHTIELSAGDVVKLGYAQQGVYCYIAVSGGFDIEPFLGSCSTVVREGLGGLNGGPLLTGDLLAFKPAYQPVTHCWLASQHQPRYSNKLSLRVIPTYQSAWFDRVEKRKFYQSSYRLTSDCDRMGFRLEGEKIITPQKNLTSEGISLGAIQIPPNGQPIVLMKDRQTIGGYPKIATVLSCDLAKLSQLRQGSEVSFRPISHHQARKEVMQSRHDFLKTPLNCRPLK